jgi:cysteine desulfurase family protein (TIGR01976 family)
MSLDLTSIRAQFPALSALDGTRPRIYFDNPAGTQVPRSVVARMEQCLLDSNANLGGYFETSRLAGEVVDGARRAMADFVNAESADEIVFGQNMTSLTFHLSRSLGRRLQKGDEIIVSRMDHDANVEPWLLLARDHGLAVRWLPFEVESFEFDLERLDELLTNRTKLVCVGVASNLTGTINDVAGICERARAAGAWTYIDAVQSAPHLLTDVQGIGCDFLVSSAYKFFGPHQGILWGRGDLLRELEAYRVRPAPSRPPECFEPGTQSHEGMAGTAAAVDYLASIGASASRDGHIAASRRECIVAAFELLLQHERRLASRLVQGLGALPGVTVQGITDATAMDRRLPTVSFTHRKLAPANIAEALAERGIFVWSGHNYALEAAKALGILDSGGAVRIGAVHYNTLDEIDTLLDALSGILR